MIKKVFMPEQCKFATLHLNEPKYHCNNVIWKDEMRPRSWPVMQKLLLSLLCTKYLLEPNVDQQKNL